MADKPTDSSDQSEITWLSHQLQKIDLQLQALTSGEVDAVIGPGGQSYLLQQAQTQLLRDDREQRDLAKQLRIERSKLLAAQAVGKIGSWSLDVASGVAEWSEEMHRIWQTDAQHFVPVYAEVLKLVHPLDRELVAKSFAGSRERDAGAVLEHRLALPGGVTKFVEERWEMELDENGKPARAFGTCQDISERRRSEEALRQSQAQLSIASRLGRIGAWTLDLTQPHVVWSEEVCTIHEVPPGTSPTLAEAIDFYAPEYRDIIGRAANDCTERGTPFDLELEILTRSGRRVWVRAMGEAVRDSIGRVRMIQGAFQDLSDRKREEQETRRLALRLTTTLESLTIGFHTTDRDWRFTYVNAEAERLLGRRRDDLIGKTLWEAFPEIIGTVFERSFRDAVKHKHSTLIESQLSAVAPWLRATAYPSEEGLAVYLRDISLERAERQHLKLLETSVARLNDMLVIVSVAPQGASGRLIEFVNDAFVRFTGYSREEVVGKTRGMLDGPATDPLELQRLDSALTHLQPVRAELVNYKKSGEAYWVEVDIVPVAAQGRAITHFVGVERDITERKGHEEALRQLNLELEERVRVRTAELTVAREDAEQATRAKSTFLATMSHEIRTPMNGVLGLVEVLSQSSLLPSQAEMVQLIHDSAGSLLNIIDDILDFSKIEAGKLRIESAPLRLNNVVEKACGLLQSMARSRNVDVTVHVAPDVPDTVLGDEHRLRQILINLLGNAIKFSSSPERRGSVSVRAELLQRRPHAVSVELAVADNGVGIDQETMQRLFKPFSQADESTTRRFGGTGLGLAITDMLVRLMGGEIEVQSALGKGATFRVRLPFQTVLDGDIAAGEVAATAGARAAAPEATGATAPIAHAAVHSQGRILIAEDNDTNREVIQRQLKLLGYTAEMTIDGTEALQRWRSAEYALVLTDLRMPEMDGYALAAAIRAEEIAPRRTAIVALTANALPEEEARCRAAGMDDYLVKPVRLARLKEVLGRWLLPALQSADASPDEATPTAAEQPVDLSVLTALIGDDPAGIRTVLKKFRATSERISDDLHQAINAGLAPPAREFAHKLKSGALSIGARSLGELCAEIERVAASGRADLLTALQPEFRTRFDAVRAWLIALEG